MVTSRRRLPGIERAKKNLLSLESIRVSVREETNAVSDTTSRDREKPTPKAAQPSEPPTPRGRSPSRKRTLKGRSQSGKSDSTAVQTTSRKALALNYCVTIVEGMRNNPIKGRRRVVTKSAVAVVENVRQLGCVSQDAEPPESVTISRKGTKVLGPIRRVRFTRAALRQANIREGKGPPLKKYKCKSSHQRSPCSVKFEDRSHSGRGCKTRAMRPRRCVGTCQENP